MQSLCVFAFALLLAAPVCGAAQEVSDSTPDQPPPQQPVPQGSILGHLTCADTHLPARGARITLFPLAALGIPDDLVAGYVNPPPMAISGLDGSFLLPHIAPGEYAVLAFAPGYLPDWTE